MIVAHALGGIKDLPVPGEFFLVGGAVVLGVSFIALGALWTEPHLEDAEEGRPLPPWAQRLLLSRALHAAVAAIGTAIFVLVTVAAFAGRDVINLNLAPTVVWVLFWLGLVWVSILVGNVWAALSPWRAVADAVAWLARPLRWQPFPYPDRLGRWPAAALLFAFTAMELVYPTPAEPRALGGAIVVYSAITWCGMLLFGRAAWLANGEAFHVYFGLFGRMAPLAVREDEDGRRVVVGRPPLVGLASLRATPGTLAFVAVMLGSVGFDSLTRSSAWQNFRASHLTSQPELALVQLAFEAGVVLFVACAYLAAVRLARVGEELEPGEEPSLAPYFLASLVPIALVYSIAHYVSLVLIQGQYAIPLASDPLGKGWDLFGSAGYLPDPTVISPHALWYTQVGVLVGGHVLGLVLAHDRAVWLYEGKAALRSQYAMLMLMVLYTVGGLYLLSRP